jgi:hypothetical protein
MGSLVMVDGKIGKIINGVYTHLVEGGGAGGSGDGVSAEVAETESVGMETEDMEPTERRTYLDKRYGPGSADAFDRATQGATSDPGGMPGEVNNGKNVYNGQNCSTPDSAADSMMVSKYFTVGQLSSGIYQAENRHSIPTTTALNLSRGQVICNLKFLATNSLDPFKDWLTSRTPYTFKPGSGFRNATNGSDHNRGQAADLHIFKGNARISREELRLLAVKALKEAKIPFTQFLLEYSGPSSFGWIHLANRQSGNSGLHVGYSLTGGAPYHPNMPVSV